MDYPIEVDSNFMAISNASSYEVIFYLIKGALMCGKRVAMNHYLVYSFGILNL
jgi:hypothetical protein